MKWTTTSIGGGGGGLLASHKYPFFLNSAPACSCSYVRIAYDQSTNTIPLNVKVFFAHWVAHAQGSMRQILRFIRHV